jgi:hypothetical protein
MEFTTPNIVVANPIPDETKIYYSKTEASIKLAVLSVALILGLYLMATNIFEIDMVVFSVLGVGCVFACYLIFLQLKILNSDIPRIVINANGLQTDTTPFFIWDEIKNAKVLEIGFGRGRTDYLIYYIPGDREVSIKLDSLNITASDCKTLLHFYQERNKNPAFKY